VRRVVKLVFHEQRVNCPLCGTLLIYNSPTETIVLAGRSCLKCGKGFVIENNFAKRLPAKKRPQKA
jgi:ribosomal protein S27AE